MNYIKLQFVERIYSDTTNMFFLIRGATIQQLNSLMYRRKSFFFIFSMDPLSNTGSRDKEATKEQEN